MTPKPLSTLASFGIYPLRLIQLGSVVISGYAICYLLYMHDMHYCRRYRYRCAPATEPTSVPISEVLLLIASIITVLDFFLFFAVLILRAHKKPCLLAIDNFTQLGCTSFSLFLYSICLVSFASTPVVRETWPYCYNVWENNVYLPPEKYFCIVTQNAVSSGLVVWITSVLICLCAVIEVRKDRGVGAIRLGGGEGREEGDGEEIRTLLGEALEEGGDGESEVLG
ncbi:hypothetical protein QBC44DRAFT_387832 [Cladorrhinum sp. PSN332]|nr:hypothetical protein QBC44DRAFT_387832 [Cladorrhinum sp. PSN332]